jgi:hypothetical protein
MENYNRQPGENILQLQCIIVSSSCKQIGLGHKAEDFVAQKQAINKGDPYDRKGIR